MVQESPLGPALKISPFGGTSHAKRILLENVRVGAKQVNSGFGKYFWGQLIKKRKKLNSSLPSDDCLNFTAINSEVSVAGFDCKTAGSW